MTKRVELLAPAGDLNRGIIALDFGADAIYFGAQQYSLRARASNFTPDNIREISEYAHSKNKHIYLVANILCHEPMLPGFKPFLDNVMKYKPDAFISSDPFIISSIHKNYPEAQIHVSTQQSITNSKGALFFKKNGATRVILSREVSYDELKQMTKALNGAIEVETFVHGAVCIAYSGRCMLSNNFCFRDANIGGCAQSCRWQMSLFDGDKEISEYFTMSAKDMCQLQNTKKLIKANVASFKIEGRMKSEHYIATVVNDYRKTIDAYYDGVNPGKQYINDVAAAANRETSIAWFDGKPGIQQMLYHEEAKKVTQNFVFSITSKVNANTYVILSRNNFKLTDKFEILSQKQKDIVNIGVSKIVDKDGNEIEVAKTPMSVLTVTFEKDIDLLPNDIVRIKAK